MILFSKISRAMPERTRTPENSLSITFLMMRQKKASKVFSANLEASKSAISFATRPPTLSRATPSSPIAIASLLSMLATPTFALEYALFPSSSSPSNKMSRSSTPPWTGRTTTTTPAIQTEMPIRKRSLFVIPMISSRIFLPSVMRRSRRLFVHHIDWNTTDQTLENSFSEYISLFLFQYTNVSFIVVRWNWKLYHQTKAWWVLQGLRLHRLQDRRGSTCRPSSSRKGNWCICYFSLLLFIGYNCQIQSCLWAWYS